MDFSEEMALMKEHLLKRKMGDAKGGEFRRIYIIYFLSRMGKIEQPHLFSVRLLNGTGVYLRDVKRWLSDLRGKDMPEAFAWSYKRRYKSSYVWQDLLDDDLITPFSDSEFVLKGSDMSVLYFEPCSCKHSAAPNPVQNSDPPEDKSRRSAPRENSNPKTDVSGEPETDDPNKGTVPFEVEGDRPDDSSSPASGGLKRENRKTSSSERNRRSMPSGPSFPKNMPGHSLVLRNPITCGAVETNESAMRTINRRRTGYGARGLGGNEQIVGGSPTRNGPRHSRREAAMRMPRRREEGRLYTPTRIRSQPSISPSWGPIARQTSALFSKKRICPH